MSSYLKLSDACCFVARCAEQVYLVKQHYCRRCQLGFMQELLQVGLQMMRDCRGDMSMLEFTLAFAVRASEHDC
jgi:hypothetical protein